MHPFWEKRRPRLAPTLYSFPRPEFNPWRYPLAEGTPLFRLWTAAKTAKFWVLTRLLRLCRHPALARRLWSGWQVGHCVSVPVLCRMDFPVFGIKMLL